jgi:hypothetical protein
MFDWMLGVDWNQKVTRFDTKCYLYIRIKCYLSFFLFIYFSIGIILPVGPMWHGLAQTLAKIYARKKVKTSKFHVPMSLAFVTWR